MNSFNPKPKPSGVNIVFDPFKEKKWQGFPGNLTETAHHEDLVAMALTT